MHDLSPEPPVHTRRRPGPAARLALWVIQGYKILISPLFTGSCRYLPSCADYAAIAVIDHGVLKGSWLALRRLARCHPLGSSGLDPVPPAGPSKATAAPSSR